MENQGQKPEEFTEKFYPVLISIARRYLPETYAQDAVQEAISRFWADYNEGQPIEKWEAYLIGILKNVIHEFKRDQHKYCQKIGEMSDPDQNQEQEYQQQEKREIVRRCFDKLNPSCQELLILHFLDGRSFNELERLLERPHSSLHRQCRDNLIKFENELKKYGIN